MDLTYSNTMAFKNCRRKFKFRNILEIVPKARPLYYTTGGAAHVGLEDFYRDKNIYEILDDVNDYFINNQPDNSEGLEKWGSDRALTKEIMIRYIKHYPLSKENFKVVKLEFEFNVPIINPETGAKSTLHRFKGKIDGLVIKDGLYWLMEHKTTAQLSANYKKQLTLDNQSIAYIEAVERQLGIKIQGVIYNVIVKDVPSEPKVLKNGELSTAKNQKTTPYLFREKIVDLGLDPENYREYLEYLKYNQKEYFYREYIAFSENDIEEWREELWDIQKNVREAEKKNQYYKNTSQCAVFGTCAYWDICTAYDKQAVIEMSYEKKEKNSELKKEGENE